MKYRSRVDIAATMLQSAIGGATKTKLMYSAFLSHSQVEEYLKFLLDKGLVSAADAKDRKHYAPTEEGFRFLRMYDKIKDSVSPEAGEGVAAKTETDPHKAERFDEAAQPPDERAGEEAPRLRSKETEAPR